MIPLLIFSSRFFIRLRQYKSLPPTCQRNQKHRSRPPTFAPATPYLCYTLPTQSKVHMPNPTNIANSLTAWHPDQQRALPWRTRPAGDRDAYPVWISESMAQQTRIDTVIGYFERWMERFPTRSWPQRISRRC